MTKHTPGKAEITKAAKYFAARDGYKWADLSPQGREVYRNEARAALAKAQP